MLATLYTSATCIAAPAAMRIALPQAKPGAANRRRSGHHFVFQCCPGTPLYHWLVRNLYRFGKAKRPILKVAGDRAGGQTLFPGAFSCRARRSQRIKSVGAILSIGT